MPRTYHYKLWVLSRIARFASHAVKRTVPFVTFLALLLTAFQVSAQTSPSNSPSAANQSNITVKDGLLSMDVRDAELTGLLKEIARQGQIELILGQDIQGIVSAKMKDVPIEEALKQICKNWTLVFEPNPDKASYRVVKVGAFSSAVRAGSASSYLEEISIKDPTQRVQLSAASQASGATALQGSAEKTRDSQGRLLYKPGELLVRFKKGTTEGQIEALHHVQGNKTIGKNDRLKLHRVKIKEGLTEEEAIKHYAASPLVELVERHALRYPNRVPNDPFVTEQWAIQNISLPKAWDFGQDCPEVIIAVVDTGVDYAHPDLSDNIWVNAAEKNGAPGIDDDSNGFIDDVYGWDFADGDATPLDVFRHGTHVAGIIGAKGNNGQGVAGVCWTAKLMVLKAQADDAEEMDDLAVINALQYAADQGVRIINCSFGGDAYSQAEYDAFAELKTAGILAVCAAGNSSQDIDAPSSQVYPASYDLDNILGVAASNQSGSLANFSNFGAISVDIMAPGVSIKSTTPSTYAVNSGTSMATPYVSGIAGLILSKNPQMSYAAVKSTIMNKVDLVPSVAGKIVSGGKINALAALCSTNTVTADLTFDHQISLADAILSFQILSGLAQPVCSPTHAPNLDVNGDGKIGMEEVIYLLQELAGTR